MFTDVGGAEIGAWQPDTHVASDTDATIAQALQLGGTSVRAAEDSPFGRLAELTDSTGAPFRVVQNQAG